MSLWRTHCVGSDWKLLRQCVPEIRKLEAERDALAERADALHKALRDRSIGYFAFGYRGHEQEECCLCGRNWKRGEPERHAEGCLAAPSAPKEAA